MTLRIVKEHYKGAMLFVGPWACRISWTTSGRFGNGSLWFSGWAKWRDE